MHNIEESAGDKKNPPLPLKNRAVLAVVFGAHSPPPRTSPVLPDALRALSAVVFGPEG